MNSNDQKSNFWNKRRDFQECLFLKTSEVTSSLEQFHKPVQNRWGPVISERDVFIFFRLFSHKDKLDLNQSLEPKQNQLQEAKLRLPAALHVPSCWVQIHKLPTLHKSTSANRRGVSDIITLIKRRLVFGVEPQRHTLNSCMRRGHRESWVADTHKHSNTQTLTHGGETWTVLIWSSVFLKESNKPTPFTKFSLVV